MGIEVKGVAKRFGSVVAVEDFSLRAERGELLAIVGPSGCGKTTLLRMMAGLEQADTGRVFIGGEDATRWPPDRRNVGFVFQQFALFPNMNVADNIGYGLRRRRVPARERQRRVAELLAMIGMEQYGQRRPNELSAGQQQRVALARALAPEPRTLLLDEPLSALDAAIRYQLRDELRRVQRRVGITTILVTHDQEEALAVADRVAVMNEGRLEQLGSPWAVYDRPRTNFVAHFIGRGNFLAGEARGDGIWLPGLGLWPEAAGGKAPLPAAPPGVDRSVTVLLRPESILLESASGGEVDDEPSVDFPDDGPPADGLRGGEVRGQRARRKAFRGRATVQDIVFGGERVQVHVQFHSDEPDGAEALRLTVAVPSGAVPGLERERGNSVNVVIPYEALRLLPD